MAFPAGDSVRGMASALHALGTVTRRRAQGEPSGYTILVVDDQPETLVSVKLVLEREGHHVLLADGGACALTLFGQHHVDLLLVDYFMPHMTGEELVAEVRKLDRDVQIVLHTGYAGEKPPRDMLHKLDIQGYHDKAEGPDRLLLWVDVALKAAAQLHCVREAEAIKAQLLANLSHEFRTPLNIILGYLEILREELLTNATAHESLDRVQRNAETLLRLVEDFLQLSDLDMRVAAVRTIGVDGAAVKGEFLRYAELMIRDKPIRFEWRVPDGLPPIAADPAKLGVIVMNLLSNAVKFTAAGAITVTAEASDDSVTFAISDTGIGIASEEQERIFEAFLQLDGGDAHRHAGIGIGLAIARKLARLMGGDITVASALGAGSTFSLRIPSMSRDTARPAAGAPVGALAVGV